METIEQSKTAAGPGYVKGAKAPRYFTGKDDSGNHWYKGHLWTGPTNFVGNKAGKVRRHGRTEKHREQQAVKLDRNRGTR